MKAFSHINIGEKISFIIDVKITAYWLLVKNAQVLIWRSKHYVLCIMYYVLPLHVSKH